jgi:hypothetical protein
LRKRTVISLSPTTSYQQFEFSPRGLVERPGLANENKEESPAPMFNDLIKPDLPEIDEVQNVEDVLEEEKNCEIVNSHEKTGDRTNEVKAADGDLAKGANDVGKIAPVGRKELGVAKGVVKKPVTSRGIVKRRTEDVLEFMEDGKMKKKLTKSQERGLLDRLQGFSTKFLNNNK